MEHSSNILPLVSQVLMCDVSVLIEPVLVVLLVLQHAVFTFKIFFSVVNIEHRVLRIWLS